MFKEAGILFLITLISGLALGFVYEVTADARAYQKELKIQKTCKEAFAEAETFEEIGVVASEEVALKASENGVSFDTLYQAKNAQGNVIGFIVSVISSEGYGGDIGLYVGIQMDGTIKGVSILEINETVGLGMEAGKVLTPQYEDKNVKEFLYTKTGAKEANEVDAISGATITTKAINNAVNMALNMFWNDLDEAGGESHE
ncbi:MAG: FMN-binding protein [Lachnospiraceae bacterium]|nr:FMN-binding protein [Lachnospiraceae bacterium]